MVNGITLDQWRSGITLATTTTANTSTTTTATTTSNPILNIDIGTAQNDLLSSPIICLDNEDSKPLMPLTDTQFNIQTQFNFSSQSSSSQ